MRIKFENDFIDLGRVETQTRTKVVFKVAEGNTANIDSIIPGCGMCTSIGKVTDDSIEVIFSSGRIPRHLKRLGKKEYSTSKSIRLMFKNGSVQIIKYKAIVWEKVK